MIVIDASATIELLLGTPRGRQIGTLLATEPSLAAPHLLDLEVAQVLRRLVAKEGLATVRAEQAFDDLAALGIDRHGHEDLLSRIWQLRDNLTAYDASYVALAEATGAALLTCDAKLAAAPGHRAQITLIA